MESIYIEATAKTPKISFDYEKGLLELEGRSIPENSIEFYKPLLEWLNKYISNPKKETQLNFKLEYFNTSSSKFVLDIFKKLEQIFNNGNKVVINWYCEEDDEDMKEAGENYQNIIKIPIRLHLLESE